MTGVERDIAAQATRIDDLRGDPALGSVLRVGLSHPCTVFDKWRIIPVVEGDDDDPLVVDLGYGALPVTTLDLAMRLRQVRSDVRVLGLEIDPHRVDVARAAAGPGARA